MAPPCLYEPDCNCHTARSTPDGDSLQMRVVSDESCVPELRPEQFEQITGDMRFGVSGWIKQQLIKLACSFTIQVR